MLKRSFDLTLAALGLVLLSPLLLVVAACVRWRLGAPVFFRQARPGRGGRVFVLIKFRTMRALQAADGGQRCDAERLTPFGRALRKTSLDELPELWNVLRGEMSIVGPRPLLVDYLSLYTSHQARRHEVRPGITGWAQVNGRNQQTWAKRFEHDIWYVEHRSLWLDLRILALTLGQLFAKGEVNAPGHATMPRFEGGE